MRYALLLAALLIATPSWAQSAKSWAGAMWVWDEPDANKTPQTNDPRYLRLAFDLSATPKAAELWVTADNLYTAYVNGQKVGAGKDWSTVDRYDIAKHLVVGKNVLAIQATNQGGVAGAIARLHVKTADKKDLFVVTNDKCKIQRAGSVSDGWTTAGFDDSAWSNALVLGDTTIAPWNLAGSSVANASGSSPPGKGLNYGSNAVDKTIKTRLTAQEQLKHFIVPKDFEIELVAADPVVINPITMVLDDKGRIIVSESHTYRYGPPGSPIKPFANPVIRLDPDGKGGFTRTLIADGFDDPVMGIAIKGDKLWLTANNYLYTYDLPADPPAAQPKGANTHFAPKGQQHTSPGQSAAPPWVTTPSPDIALKGQNKSSDRALLRPFRASDSATGLPRALPWADLLLPLRGEFQAVSHREDVHENVALQADKPKPLATNKKILLTDKSKAWNPFGMFVLEWGPDGKLYLSVGNHGINIHNNHGESISSRGGSGLVMRMNPDGTKMERLVHGLRVPYSFEFDPFGHLWLLSNGEGNPDRFVRVIDGVDYHCYSRPAIDNNWLAGNHPLAPPCEEVHGGAHTQLLRYYAAAYPGEYQGNLFCCNWGRHGFAGPNRGIFRFVLDARNNVIKKDTLVTCTDPHFRPSHIVLDPDGNLLIADWYGRDDESDMTGRIWRLKHIGKDRPVVKHKLDSPEWKNDDYAISALGSPSHLIRDKAMELLVGRGRKSSSLVPMAIKNTRGAEPLSAANSLWCLARVGNAQLFLALAAKSNPDWKVRRLAVELLRRNPSGSNGIAQKDLADVAKYTKGDKSPAVRLERAISLANSRDFVDVLNDGAANDPFLRYQAAWHLAKLAEAKDLTELLASDDPDIRLAGLIAIDVACYENFPTKKIALEALGKALENPGKLDHQLLLMVAQLDGDASIVPGLQRLIGRDDLPTATIAKAVLVLKAKSGGNLASAKLSAAAGKRLIEAVEKGSLKIASPADQLVIFEFLESEGPTPFALKQIEGQLRSPNKELKQAAHTLARRFGPKASPLADGLWPSVLNLKTKFEDTIEYLSTIARIEKTPKIAEWRQLLEHKDPFVRIEAVRWWRGFKENLELAVPFRLTSADLVKKDARIEEDLELVLDHLGGKTRPAVDKDKLTKYAIAELAEMPDAERPKRAAMGLQVFERNACTKCHTTATATTLLAPSLKGVAAQKVEYLIESVLYPSKIIKTGWEVENIELKNGKTLVGLVKDEGKHLRVLNLDKDELVLKSDIASRSTSKISVMPEGQEATLSRREFVDLIAYLQTLK
jgi:putative heme-binding domain-containing protein